MVLTLKFGTNISIMKYVGRTITYRECNMVTRDRYYRPANTWVVLRLFMMWAIFIVLPCEATIDEFKMEDLCGSDVSMILEDVHQLRVTLDDYGAPASHVKLRECDVSLEGWYTWPRLMLYFEDLNINCTDGHLSLYDGKEGTNYVPGLPEKLCGSDPPSGVYVVVNGTLTVKYVAYTAAVRLDVISLIITAFSTNADYECPSSAFKCTNGRCIETDIRCNGHNSCGDHSGCRTDVTSVALAGVVLGSLVGVAILLTIVILVACQIKKQKQKSTRSSSRSTRYTADSSEGKPVSQNASYNFAAAIFQDQRQKSKGIVGGQNPAYPPNWTSSLNLDDNAWTPDENDVRYDVTDANIDDVDIDFGERSCVVSNSVASVAEGTDNPASDLTDLPDHVDRGEDFAASTEMAQEEVCKSNTEYVNSDEQKQN